MFRTVTTPQTRTDRLRIPAGQSLAVAYRAMAFLLDTSWTNRICDGETLKGTRPGTESTNPVSEQAQVGWESLLNPLAGDDR